MSSIKIEVGQIIKTDIQDMTILEVFHKINKKGNKIQYVKYKCNKCGNIHDIRKPHLLNGVSCSVCGKKSKKIIKGINDVATTNPSVMKYLVNKKDGYENGRNSKKLVKVKCPDCGRFLGEKRLSVLCDYGKQKCICNDNISYSEKFMFDILTQLNIDFMTQVTSSVFSWCKKKRYDFYLIDKNTIIETNGMQHYKENTYFSKNLSEQRKSDYEKRELALNNGINNYIQLDCRKSEKEYIKNSILNSKLNELYDLSNINWSKADQFATKNLAHEFCLYYEENKNNLSVNEMFQIFKIGKSQGYNYLHKGNEYGWCKYYPNHGRKKVLFIENNEIFESTQECAEILSKRYNLNLSNRSIRSACRSKTNYYKGLHFKYI